MSESVKALPHRPMTYERKVALLAYVRGSETELERIAGHHEVGLPLKGACIALLHFLEGRPHTARIAARAWGLL